MSIGNKIQFKKIVSIDIAGTLISNVSLVDTVSIFNEWIENNERKRVCVTPVNCLVWAHQSPALKKLYNAADLTLCDGVPLLWVSKFLDTPLKGRVTGLDLFPLYVQECYNKGYSMFLLGAKEGVAQVLKQQFEKMYPGIQVNGIYSPPFADKFSEEENNKMIALINANPCNILWVSLTAPKQDYWIAQHLSKLNVNIAIGVGGAFEVTAGLIQRAPLWMQKSGLEWLFRFVKEPKRLFRRYILEAPIIIPLVIKQKVKKND